eukprot:726241-Hanusia_phi.AAC.1
MIISDPIGSQRASESLSGSERLRRPWQVTRVTVRAAAQHCQAECAGRWPDCPGLRESELTLGQSIGPGQTVERRRRRRVTGRANRAAARPSESDPGGDRYWRPGGRPGRAAHGDRKCRVRWAARRAARDSMIRSDDARPNLLSCTDRPPAAARLALQASGLGRGAGQ